MSRAPLVQLQMQAQGSEQNRPGQRQHQRQYQCFQAVIKFIMAQLSNLAAAAAQGEM